MSLVFLKEQRESAVFSCVILNISFIANLRIKYACFIHLLGKKVLTVMLFLKFVKKMPPLFPGSCPVFPF